eukprot:scaffold131595_cov53-Attheya_sp.AAC.3
MPDKDEAPAAAKDAPPPHAEERHLQPIEDLLEIGQQAISDGKKGWKTAVKLISQAQTGVNVENKVGTSARRLDVVDPLSIISLASQRALQSYGKSVSDVNASEKDMGSTAPIPSSKGVVEFPALPVDKSSPFKVRQPAFKCRELYGDKFKEIRSAFGVSELQFYSVLGLPKNQKTSSYSVIGSGDTSGKSPSFFFLSPDQRFILKSCTKRDVRTLSKILDGYRGHILSCKGDTSAADNTSLLPRYIGLYKFEFDDEDVADATLVVMTNFFAGAYEIHEKYDLKGSTFNRKASEKEQAKKSPVYKDLDWLVDGRKISYTTKKKTESVLKQLEKDTDFLRENNLIDYSLLVGVHEKDKENSLQRIVETMPVIFSTGTKFIYYFGIVDVLTPYVLQKKAETVITGQLRCRPGISCQPPVKYQERFMAFCKNEVFTWE